MIDDIITGINLLFTHGQVVEVRGERLDGTIFSKFFNDRDQLARALTTLDETGEFKALWYTLQELRADVDYSKKAASGAATNRNDVKRYNWLVIDIDRPKGDPNKKLNATDAELEALGQVRDRVIEYLKGSGFPDPVIACSGNGWHLLYKLGGELGDVTPADHWMIEDVLHGIDHHMRDLSGDFKDGKVCQIDTTLSEPEQIIKAYGTMSRKSRQDGGERPWRRSYIHSVPLISPVQNSVLLTVAMEAPKKGTTAMASPSREYPLCREQWLEDYGVEHLIEWSGVAQVSDIYEKSGDTHYAITPCLGHSHDDLHEHTGKDAERHSEIILHADGGIGYACFSKDLTIREVLEKLERLKGEKYPHRIFEREPYDASLIEGFAEEADAELVQHNVSGELAFASPEEATAAGEEYNNKGRLCRVCREGTVIGALDSKCSTCRVDEEFAVESGKFEMVKANDHGVVRQIVGVDASTVKPKPIEWLWRDKIPANAITWLYGAQGSAKSAITCELAAIVSTGRDFPDAAKNEMGPRRVLMYNAEDDIERTVLPRLMAMDANLKNIVLFDESSFREYENGELLKRSFDMTKDLPILATMLTKYNDVAVLICDPITGIWGGKDINRDREVVKVLEKLKVLCERKRLTFLGISHTNKRSDVSALEKVLGSSSITGKCRAAHYISQDPESDGEHDYVIAWAKGNLSGKKGGMKFSTVGVEMEFEGKKNSYPKVVWGEQTNNTADDVFAQKREKRESKDRKLEAAKVLINFLISGGPVKSFEIYNRGKDEGIGKGTMERAADEMTKDKQILRRQRDRYWWMLLPDHLAEFDKKPVDENQHIPEYDDVFSS